MPLARGIASKKVKQGPPRMKGQPVPDPVFESTYLEEGVPARWLRGNHHGHSDQSDGADDPIAILKAYEKAGYDYLALSEHDRLLSPAYLQSHTSLCILPAIEVDGSLPKAQLTPREIMDWAHTVGGLFVFNHPNWLPFPDYATDDLLDTLEGLQGMEIYTGVIRRLEGSPLATNRWDRLLSKGWRVFGHATDDQHCSEDQFIAWNSVQWHGASAPDAGGLMAALSKGRFYATTGVEIFSIAASDDGETVAVSSDGDELRWITSGGSVFRTTPSGDGRCSARECLAAAREASPVNATGPGVYLRIECHRKDGAAAWSQPFWLNSSAQSLR